MKKFKFAALVLALATILSLGAFSLVSAAENTVNIDDFTDLNAFGQWVEQLSWDEDGFSGTIDNTGATEGNKSGGLGLVKQFDVSEGKEVKITFRKPIYSGTETTESGERALNDGQSASEAVDIRFENKNNQKVALFRIWPDGAKVATQNASYVEVWNPTDPDWTKYDASDWIKGVATDNSSFTVGFNMTDYLCMDIAGREYGKVKSSTAGYEEFLQSVFEGCETLEIYFGREIPAGTKDTTILLDVNGQSLVPDADGNIVDNVAPVIPKLKVETEEIAINTAYSVRCEKWFGDPTTRADFSVRPVYDFIAGNNVKLEFVVSNDEGKNWKALGEYNQNSGMITNVRFDTVGKYQIAIRATDTVGNTAMGTPVEIVVVKGFDITLQGEMPASGTVGQAVTIPAAISSDKNNQPHDVVVTVENPIGVEVDVENNSFVPTIAGVYYVTYTSEYTEGDKTYKASAEYTVNISAATEQPGGENGDGEGETGETGGGCSGTAAVSIFGAGGGMVAAAVALIKRKRR